MAHVVSTYLSTFNVLARFYSDPIRVVSSRCCRLGRCVAASGLLHRSRDAG
jgi:hypothetical protein